MASAEIEIDGQTFLTFSQIEELVIGTAQNKTGTRIENDTTTFSTDPSRQINRRRKGVITGHHIIDDGIVPFIDYNEILTALDMRQNIIDGMDYGKLIVHVSSLPRYHHQSNMGPTIQSEKTIHAIMKAAVFILRIAI
jgi:hypothetical protein